MRAHTHAPVFPAAYVVSQGSSIRYWQLSYGIVQDLIWISTYGNDFWFIHIDTQRLLPPWPKDARQLLSLWAELGIAHVVLVLQAYKTYRAIEDCIQIPEKKVQGWHICGLEYMCIGIALLIYTENLGKSLAII